MNVCTQVYVHVCVQTCMCVHTGGCVHTGTHLLLAFPGGQCSREASELLKLQEPAGWCSVPSSVLRPEGGGPWGREVAFLETSFVCSLAFFSCSFFQ